MTADWRKSLPLLFAVFLAALFGCAIGCAIAMKLVIGGAAVGHMSHEDAHDWLHEQLNLTAEQEVELEEIEARFASTESAREAALASANAELAKVLKEDRSYTPRVEAAVEKIHHAMAELQKATIEHLIEMEEVLTPEQYDRLLELAGDALSHD
ncbi:MAG: Spy/CpxP family protein refolding chaperone [Verrucomicrobiales bacterium]|jgi:Spy/CpxP family protein refolding chaperone